MVFRVQRRFIAGAVCPKCTLMDKLVVFKKDNMSFRECVSCGFHQEMEFSPAFKPLPTRLDLAKEKAKSEDQQDVIRIVTPKSKYKE
jgi:uncharacterized protein